MPPFASFSPFCSSPADNVLSARIDTSSPLPHCNLFFASLLHVSEPPALTRLFNVPTRTASGVINTANTTDPANGLVTESSNADDPLVGRYVARAGSGVGVSCDVGRIGVEGSLGDIAQIIACSVCFLSALYLIYRSVRRRAAVGRAEMVHLFMVFAATLVVKIFTTGNVLKQGSAAISVLSALHVGLLALSGWILLLNAAVAFQLLEDGSVSSLLILYAGGAVFFATTTYFALDQAFGITSLFLLSRSSAAERDLGNVALMLLGVLWPYLNNPSGPKGAEFGGRAVLVYFLVMGYVVYFHLRERKPLKWFTMAFLLFAGAQAVQFLASHPLCVVSNARLTAGFLNTLLETASLWLLFVAWKSITEDDWYDDLGAGEQEEMKNWEGYGVY
ncbi:hypothetical protein QFC20_005885 [Naganishia adeliensis]|uniref:Uncharacterized protein n=1 Tax=Naganishia adeliensis TaxID=92952 RepID=A0ACC2VJP5_9TREE|nr:hypothetical protein QFC20_005885 [Naganishia adeliensis]